ncbi:MAG: MEDS domain-containing protein [Candidatus Gygaella obscura]|nr:MEDS domain-containing protein [Candidatus Gygaella obscura]
MRNSGVPILGDLDWGAHICQFYRTNEELLEILIGYFKAGLENNEFCIWSVPETLGIKKAKEVLSKKVKKFDTYLKNNQIEIVDYKDIYFKAGIFSAHNALLEWYKRSQKGLDAGFEGVRISGDGSWGLEEHWLSISYYEAEINRNIGGVKTIALCTYCMNNLESDKLIRAGFYHDSTIVKKEGKWRVFNAQTLRNIKL